MGDQSEQKQAELVPAKGTGFSATLIIGVVVAVLVIILAAQNTGHVRFHFLWWHVRSPLIVIILATALAGIVVDEVGGLFWRRRRRRVTRAGRRLRRTSPRASTP
jgi:uncharacterized integral membrane protein